MSLGNRLFLFPCGSGSRQGIATDSGARIQSESGYRRISKRVPEMNCNNSITSSIGGVFLKTEIVVGIGCIVVDQTQFHTVELLDAVGDLPERNAVEV